MVDDSEQAPRSLRKRPASVASVDSTTMDTPEIQENASGYHSDEKSCNTTPSVPTEAPPTIRIKIERGKFKSIIDESKKEQESAMEIVLSIEKKEAKTIEYQKLSQTISPVRKKRKIDYITRVDVHKASEFVMTPENGKDVRSSGWGNVAAHLKHLAEGKDKDKDKDKDRVYSFKSTLYFAASIMAYHTWFYLQRVCYRP